MAETTSTSRWSIFHRLSNDKQDDVLQLHHKISALSSRLHIKIGALRLRLHTKFRSLVYGEHPQSRFESLPPELRLMVFEQVIRQHLAEQQRKFRCTIVFNPVHALLGFARAAYFLIGLVTVMAAVSNAGYHVRAAYSSTEACPKIMLDLSFFPSIIVLLCTAWFVVAHFCEEWLRGRNEPRRVMLGVTMAHEVLALIVLLWPVPWHLLVLNVDTSRAPARPTAKQLLAVYGLPIFSLNRELRVEACEMARRIQGIPRPHPNEPSRCHVCGQLKHICRLCGGRFCDLNVETRRLMRQRRARWNPALVLEK